jgi:DNA-binding MarR family transcriptional regulator
MTQQKKNTIVFRQTVSNGQYKTLFNLACKEGCTVQDLIRQMCAKYYPITKTDSI